MLYILESKKVQGDKKNVLLLRATEDKLLMRRRRRNRKSFYLKEGATSSMISQKGKPEQGRKLISGVKVRAGAV